MGFAVVVAAVVVEPRRFDRGNWCLQFPKALVRNESRRTTSPEKELGWKRELKNSKKIARPLPRACQIMDMVHLFQQLF